MTLDDAPPALDPHGRSTPTSWSCTSRTSRRSSTRCGPAAPRPITLQGQRLISTTGIKCVGNTVVLDGVPYSPPYVIEAIGERRQ